MTDSSVLSVAYMLYTVVTDIASFIAHYVALGLEIFIKEVEEADVQLKILYFLLGWLFISIVLIQIVWSVWNKNVLKMLQSNGKLRKNSRGSSLRSVC